MGCYVPECPSGWSNVNNTRGRPDSNNGPLEKETMVDPTACPDNENRSWCCPTSNMPTCWWSDCNQGMCSSECSSGSVEVGSHSQLCENNGYVAACCDDENRSVSLYNKCAWDGNGNGEDSCGDSDSTCPDERSKVAESASGSGDVQCAVVGVSMAADHAATFSVRPYCCDKSDHNIEWTACRKLGMDGHNPEDPGHCPGDCPNGIYRVALDQHAQECTSGAASICCVPNAQTLTEDLPVGDVRLAEAVDLFMADPEGFCVAGNDDSSLERRDIQSNESLVTCLQICFRELR